MIFKKTFEFEIDGETIGFKFGMAASAYFCEMEGVTLSSMQNKLADASPTTAIHCAMAAARSYNESHGVKKEVTFGQAADWLDTIGVDKFFLKIFSQLEVYQDQQDKEEAKNQEAPMIAGQNGQ
jgi:hypothetical protein